MDELKEHEIGGQLWFQYGDDNSFLKDLRDFNHKKKMEVQKQKQFEWKKVENREHDKKGRDKRYK